MQIWVDADACPGEIKELLYRAAERTKIKVTLVGRLRPVAITPPLTPQIMGPAEKLVARYFPGAPLIPKMSTGATDATYLAPAGIPTYGVPGPWGAPGGSGAHGLNERHPVQSAYVSRDFLYDLVKAYADQT